MLDCFAPSMDFKYDASRGDGALAAALAAPEEAAEEPAEEGANSEDDLNSDDDAARATASGVEADEVAEPSKRGRHD